MSKKILHIGADGSFLRSFIDFVKDEFVFSKHTFLITTDKYKKPDCRNVMLSHRTLLARLKHYVFSVIKVNNSDKVILHGIFDIKLVFILFLMPWTLKKCYWVIWGGDLYDYKIGKRNWKWKLSELIRRPVIKRIGNLVTYIPGDVELARQWYGAVGKYHECLMYLSNVIDPKIMELGNEKLESHPGLNILLGNSSDASNNHIESLQKLIPYREEEIKIFAPLSYGDQLHAKKVIEKGKDWFGEKFIPLTSFMEFNEYLEFLKTIDIAIFNHKRQQAMGNTITLLALGKKVFMRCDVTQWSFFKSHGIKVYDIEAFTLDDTKNSQTEENRHRVRSSFSKINLLKQLKAIFSD